MNILKTKTVFFILIFLLYFPEVHAKKWNRDVIAFWDSRETEEREYTFSKIHHHLEFVFNHYGYRLTYIDVNQELPKDLFEKNLNQKYVGMVSWFSDNILFRGDEYIKFLGHAKDQGLKILMLGEPGFFQIDRQKNRPYAQIKNLWEKLGFKYTGDFHNNPLLMTHKIEGDPKNVEFERGLESELSGLWGISSQNPKLKPWLKVKVTGEAGEEEFHPIAVGEQVAFAYAGYEIFRSPTDYKVKWRINPFKVVKDLFGKNQKPIPDVTTMCGRRVSFIHIDGDGYVNVSLIDKKSFSGEIVSERIIKKYGFPTSVSVITAEVSSEYLGTQRTEDKVRELFSLPMVEAASHTFRHPLSWEKAPNLREKKIYLDDSMVMKHQGAIVAYEKNGSPLSYKDEILGSLKYINDKLMLEEKTNLIFWTGSCRPPKQALKLVKDNNLLNINGGDGRFDNTYDSYAGLSPLYRKIENYFQTYSGFANENIYTNLWEGPFSGFRSVIKSFENTESPIRVKPINVYYHFYSGERTSSVKALEDIYDYLKKQELFSLYASDYIKMVMSWDNVSVEEVGPGQFTISNYGHLRNFRIDLDKDKEKLYPDYDLSLNVVGHTHYQGSLYITLKSGDKANLVLTSKAPTKPYISSCNAFIDDFNSTSVKAVSREPLDLKIIKTGKETHIKNDAKTATLSLKGVIK